MGTEIRSKEKDKEHLGFVPHAPYPNNVQGPVRTVLKQANEGVGKHYIPLPENFRSTQNATWYRHEDMR